MKTTQKIRVASAVPVGTIGEYRSLAQAVRAAEAHDRKRLPNQPCAWYLLEQTNGQWAHARLVDGKLVADPAALSPAVFHA
jgi:hypothetical protein